MAYETFFTEPATGKTRVSRIDDEGNETIRDLTTDEDNCLWVLARNGYDARAQAADDMCSEARHV